MISSLHHMLNLGKSQPPSLLGNGYKWEFTVTWFMVITLFTVLPAMTREPTILRNLQLPLSSSKDFFSYLQKEPEISRVSLMILLARSFTLSWQKSTIQFHLNSFLCLLAICHSSTYIKNASSFSKGIKHFSFLSSKHSEILSLLQTSPTEVLL